MARGAGYGQGLLEGMKYVSENRRNEIQNEADRQLMQFRSEDQAMQREQYPSLVEQNKLQNLEKQIDLRIKQNALAKEEYEKNLLNNMQAGTAVTSGLETQAQGDQQLVQTNRQMGTALMQAGMPEKAKSYFEAANTYESAATNKIKASLEIKAKQIDQVGQILANVGSQDDLNEAIPQLYALGFEVPEQVRDWKNPQTRDWITKQALRSPTISKDLQDQVGFLKDKDDLTVDKQKNEVVDEKNYNMSLRERASQISATQKAGGGRQSAINERFNDRVINAGRLATESIDNIAQLPLEHTSYGGFKTEKTGFLGATRDALANKLTESDNRTYDTLMAGIERNLATLETFGIAPPVSFSKSFEKLKAVPGDDVKNRLIKLAEMRQIIETSLSGFKDKPNIPQAQKTAIQGMIDKVAKAVPYTVDDVIELESSKMGGDYTLGNQIRKEGTSKLDERAKQFKVIRD